MAEETQASAEQSAETAEVATEESAAATAKAKTYSKAEVDAMVNKAKIATRREFGDVLELRQKAEEFDKLQESAKSNEDKLRERADRAVRERDAALTRTKSTLIRSAIIAAASRLGSVDPEAVAALLSHDDLIVEGDEVIGVEEAVKALLNKKAYLRQGASRAGAEITGSGQEPTVITRSQIRAWAKNGGLTPERQKQISEAAAAGKILADR